MNRFLCAPLVFFLFSKEGSINPDKPPPQEHATKGARVYLGLYDVGNPELFCCSPLPAVRCRRCYANSVKDNFSLCNNAQKMGSVQ